MPKRNTAKTVYLSNVIGTIKEVHYPAKAVVIFRYNGKEERALLCSDKLMIDGKSVANREKFHEFVHQGSVVKFTCHSFTDNGGDRCKWFIANAWRLHPFDLGSSVGTSTMKVIYGINATPGCITEVAARYCIISFTNCNGGDENVLAFATRIYLGGQRVNSKQNLQNFLSVDDAVTFNATPCEPKENSKQCKWIATLVYRGRKPQTDCDSPLVIPPELNITNLLDFIKQATFDTKSVFIKGCGQITEILNEEYGLALVSLRYNQWESLLFHRSCVTLFGLKLSMQNLKEVFKEGDKIRYIAIPAPTNKLLTLWLGTQISVDIGPGVTEEELPPVKKLQ